MEDPPDQKHLIQLADQLGELYLLERSRNAELDDRVRRTEDGNPAPPGCRSQRWVRR